jgi:hypothetical protein
MQTSEEHKEYWMAIHKQYIDKNNMAVIPNPAYSPDLAPCKFNLFQEVKLYLKGKRFSDVLRIQQVFNGIMKEEFQICFRWQNL